MIDYAHKEMREAWQLRASAIATNKKLTNNIVEFELYDIHTDV